MSYLALQAASACSLAAPEGKGEALMVSTHTSLAALRAPSRSPLAALLQIFSILGLTLAGAALIVALHAVTAACTAALFALLGALVADVEVVPAAVELVGAVVEVV